MASYSIPLGTSEPQDFALFDDGAALDGTGIDVGLEIKYRPRGRALQDYTTSPPTVAWLNQAGGTVRVSGVDTLPAGQYYVRFSLTDGGGTVGFAPNGNDPDLWTVVTP